MQDFWLPPTHHELLQVSGSDAARFLQGQVTCDVAALQDGSFVYGATCNNKGRVITPFILLRLGVDFVLIFRRGLAERFSGALSKFLPFYKCSMQAAPHMAAAGLGGAGAVAWLQQNGWACPAENAVSATPQGRVLHLGGSTPQYLLLVTAELLTQPEAAAGLPQDDGRHWDAILLRNGHYPFSPEDCEQFTPQELQYEERQYVSFTKGCYTGQEIVARMHYRGKPKKRLYRLEFSCTQAPSAEALSLLDDAGAVIAVCSKPTWLPTGEALALAMLPIEFADTHPVLRTMSGLTVSVTRF